MSASKRICVIGAGAAGLCAIRHSIDKGFSVVCFEQANQIGGTWIYNDYIDFDDELQNTMYEGLRTNLPKEVMGFPDFLFPDDIGESFVTSDKVLRFLHLYATHFDLNKHIRLQQEVIRVRPKICHGNKSELWEVYVKDGKTSRFYIELFDIVLVCNGHYTTPKYPDIENMDKYEGKQMHSRFYKTAEPFKDETVLLIGCGPSGLDIAYQLNSVAGRVVISHHSKEPLPISPEIVQKPDIVRFEEDGAVFKDGSRENFSVVIFCTGFKFSFPFLSLDCGLALKENSIQPLYKHILNINHPSMAFIGVPFKVCPTQSFDIEIRYVLKFFTNERELPSREAMLDDLENELQKFSKKGLPMDLFHEMKERQFAYFNDLAASANLEPIKPVIAKMMKLCAERYISDYESYRNYNFRVFDDSNFESYTAEN